MNRIKKSILGVSGGLVVIILTTAFIISDPKADFRTHDIGLEDQFSLSKITTSNAELGAFKASLKFKQMQPDRPTKEYYGIKVLIANNPRVDMIFIGVTSNLNSRIEIWNKNKRMEVRELGFMNKMTWGATQTMAVEFYDQTNKKYKGKSKVKMRFYSGTGFFGDIGTISFDLSDYGDLSEEKAIGVFAKGMDSNILGNIPNFTDLLIWKNYLSFD